MIVEVHVGVLGAAVVCDVVADEHEGRQADLVKGEPSLIPPTEVGG